MQSSASEDFKRRTLSVLPTLLERLAYICSLQTNRGEYQHWGLKRAFGDQVAHDAIRRAHNEASLELIRAPIEEIYKEYKEAVSRKEGPHVLTADTLVLRAPVSGDELLSSHVRLLRDSLEAVVHQERTTPPGA